MRNESLLKLVAEVHAQEEIHLANLKTAIGKKKVRILYLNMCLVAGGLEKTIWMLGQKLDKRVFEPEIHTRYGGKWETELCQVMPVHKNENIETLIGLEGFNIVHIFNVPDVYHLWREVALIETVEGFGAIFFKNEDKRGLDKLIFCSDKIRKTVMPLVSVDKTRSCIMYNPVDMDRPITRGKLKTDDKKIIGWIGRLSPEKNPDLFLDVAEALQDKYRFVMIGEAWNPKLNIEFLQKIKERDLDIRWIRDVKPDEIMDYIADMDLVCNTSYTEGHPFCLLEAMAVKVPVVSMCVGCVSDIIDDDTGYLVYREKDYIDTVKEAIRNGKSKTEKAYTNVLINHNLKDYVRRQEIIYLESYMELLARQVHEED